MSFLDALEPEIGTTMISYDTSEYPTGVRAWQVLLEAIETASPSDEADWIEFKANVDLTKKAERPIIAKAIVAFANRDPARATRQLGGRALIVIGLEPGNIVGTSEIDPAQLHDYIQHYLAAPQPGWDHQYLTYREKVVLVITVDPPKTGDPIHCIGSSGDKVRDGEVFVRKVGQSAQATSMDLRMLSERLLAQGSNGLGISVTANAGAGPPLFSIPGQWVEEWIDAERARLMRPLKPQEGGANLGRTSGAGVLGSAFIDHERFEKFIGQGQMARSLRALDPFSKRHEEDRSPEDYEAEVDAYLDRCREQMPRAASALQHALSGAVRFKMHNLTDQNFSGVQVRVHVEGDVVAYDHGVEFPGLVEYLPRAPRIWGPWTESAFSGMIRSPLLMGNGLLDKPSSYRARPNIVNGGSADITFVPFDLRPYAEEDLDEIVLVSGQELTGGITCTWMATATNTNGRSEGSVLIQVGERIDLSEYLLHGSTATVPGVPADGAQANLHGDSSD